MLRHVALFSWNPDASAAAIRAFADGLAALPGRVPEIRSYTFGPDARLAGLPGQDAASGGADDFALVADFDDAAAYLRYAEHPAHRHLIAELLRPIVAGRHAVQYDV
ncbi:MAG: Dabb family protein [Acidimicrobiales bacterium]